MPTFPSRKLRAEALLAALAGLGVSACQKSPSGDIAAEHGPAAASARQSAAVSAKEVPAASASAAASAGKEGGCAPGGCAPGSCAGNKKK